MLIIFQPVRLPACQCVYLQDQIPQVVEKAAVSEGDTAEAQRRAAACGRALDLHLTRLRWDVDGWKMNTQWVCCVHCCAVVSDLT